MQQDLIFEAKTLILSWRNGGTGLVLFFWFFFGFFLIFGLIKEKDLIGEKLI